MGIDGGVVVMVVVVVAVVVVMVVAEVVVARAAQLGSAGFGHRQVRAWEYIVVHSPGNPVSVYYQRTADTPHLADRALIILDPAFPPRPALSFSLLRLPSRSLDLIGVFRRDLRMFVETSRASPILR